MVFLGYSFSNTDFAARTLLRRVFKYKRIREIENTYVPPHVPGEDESNPNYVQFQWNSAGITFENWQVAHFRVSGQDKHISFGIEKDS
jgi:hypothetical protein